MNPEPTASAPDPALLDGRPVPRAPDRPPRHGPVVHSQGTATLRVWAPNATRVDAVLADRDEAMEPTAPGWWAATVGAGHGDRYAFRLDGGAPLPDPAARALPEGVHQPAALVDPARLDAPRQPWRPPAFQRAVVYELHVGTFTADGTLDAAAERLPRLAELGVTHVELMPVNAFDGDRGWGYDGVAWFAVHPAYGGPEALARFVAAARAHGLAVILDVVHNHLGPSGNYLPHFGPYLADRRAGSWGEGLNLDGPGSDAVRALIGDNVRWWLGELAVDGLRLDAVHALIDTSARHLLTELRDVADHAGVARGWPATLIAESDRNDPGELAARHAGGQGMDGVWADELHHSLHVALTGEDHTYYADFRGLADVAAAYRRGFVHDGSRFASYRGRSPGAPLGDAPGWQLVGCLQNHDQVGNRAQGDRITTLAPPAAVRAAVALLVAAPHTPMLFMGEEHGETRPFPFFAGFDDPELAEAVRAGRREEFAADPGFDAAAGGVPDPTDPATFTRAKVDWQAAATAAGQARWALWAALLQLRHDEPALHAGARDHVEVVVADATRFVARRGAPNARPLLIAANLADAGGTLPLAEDPSQWTLLLATEEERFGGSGAQPAVVAHGLCLPAQSAALWAPADTAPDRG